MHDDSTALIPLRARDGSVRAYAIVDAADADWVNQWSWSLNPSGYAKRCHRPTRGSRNTTTIMLHRALLGLVPGDGVETDHISKNKLDNRRCNLRVGTHAQNMQNRTKDRGCSSHYRGVHWYAARGKWTAYVDVDGKRTNLGYFTDELEAAEVAKAARLRLMLFAVD